MIAVVLASCIALADAVQDLNRLPVKEITPANAANVLDAAIATTNCTRITKLVAAKKVTLEDAVHKTMAKKPFKMCFAAFNGAPNTTNDALVAEALAKLDYSEFDSETFNLPRTLILRHSFAITENGQNEIMRAGSVNPMFSAEIYCSTWHKTIRKTFVDEAKDAYNAVKHLVKECNCPRQAAILWWYCTATAKDYEYFPSMYNPSLMNIYYHWLYIPSKRPEYAQYRDDLLKLYKSHKSSYTDIHLIKLSKVIDSINKNKTTTLNAIDSLSTTHAKLAAALYCKNIDKVLDVLINCDLTLTPAQIEAVIKSINGLDPDYKPAEVLKALKAINQRYTLKLYDNRDTWEPVLSKIRAMIDIRQQ